MFFLFIVVRGACIACIACKYKLRVILLSACIYKLILHFSLYIQAIQAIQASIATMNRKQFSNIQAIQAIQAPIAITSASGRPLLGLRWEPWCGRGRGERCRRRGSYRIDRATAGITDRMPYPRRRTDARGGVTSGRHLPWR